MSKQLNILSIITLGAVIILIAGCSAVKELTA